MRFIEVLGLEFEVVVKYLLAHVCPLVPATLASVVDSEVLDSFGFIMSLS